MRRHRKLEPCLQRIAEAVIKIGPARIAEIAPMLPMHKVRGLGNVCGTNMT